MMMTTMITIIIIINQWCYLTAALFPRRYAAILQAQ